MINKNEYDQFKMMYLHVFPTFCPNNVSPKIRYPFLNEIFKMNIAIGFWGLYCCRYKIHRSITLYFFRLILSSSIMALLPNFSKILSKFGTFVENCEENVKFWISTFEKNVHFTKFSKILSKFAFRKKCNGRWNQY